MERVFDGDTVRLKGGEKVRLLGINTPEIAHWGSGSEAGGKAAKRWLDQRLEGREVRLVDDVEKHDRYCRRLAHVFAGNGEHVNAALVEAGLAFVDLHPPNIKYADELLAAQRRAERAGRGLWGLEAYAPRSGVPGVESGKRHWQRLRGRVVEVEKGRYDWRLLFSTGFEVRIDKRNRRYFPDLDCYRGKNLEARGWLNQGGGTMHMNLRHPSALVEY